MISDTKGICHLEDLFHTCNVESETFRLSKILIRHLYYPLTGQEMIAQTSCLQVVMDPAEREVLVTIIVMIGDCHEVQPLLQ